MLVVPKGMLMEVRAAQSLNDAIPIFLSESGKVIFASFSHPLKALLAISVTSPMIVTVFKFEQPWNAAGGINVMPSDKVNLVMLTQCAKALTPIEIIPGKESLLKRDP